MNFDSILAEINALVAEPSVYERRVPEDELRRVAQAMLARGYVPDARVLAAVEKYLQGYALWIVHRLAEQSPHVQHDTFAVVPSLGLVDWQGAEERGLARPHVTDDPKRVPL